MRLPRAEEILLLSLVLLSFMNLSRQAAPNQSRGPTLSSSGFSTTGRRFAGAEKSTASETRVSQALGKTTTRPVQQLTKEQPSSRELHGNRLSPPTDESSGSPPPTQKAIDFEQQRERVGSLDRFGCPFWGRLDRPERRDLDVCAGYFVDLCMAAVQSGGDHQEDLSCTALEHWGGIHWSACFLYQYYWHRLLEWNKLRRRGLTPCQGILPNVSAAFPVARPSDFSCICAWPEIMPEMCQYLLYPNFSLRVILGVTHHCAIQTGVCRYPFRCKVYQSYHRNYIKRLKTWKCRARPSTKKPSRFRSTCSRRQDSVV